MSVSGTPKKKDQRRNGSDPVITIRLSNWLITEIDSFANETEITRSEAIRRLIETGLEAAKKRTTADVA